VTSEIDPVFFRWWDVKPIPFFRGLRDIRKRMWSPLFEKEEHWCRPVWDKDTMIPLIPIGDWWWWCTCSYNFHIEMVIWRIYEREIYIYIWYILYYIIKGSWEAILPSYEWLLLDGIDYDEGWYVI
jgi:hypothetical protein